MGHLSNGVWSDDEQWSTDEGGRFVRGAAQFRRRASAPFVPETGRNHLYLAHACPWCHRTAIARELKGLQSVVSVSYVAPLMREGGWRFDGEAHTDPLFGAAFAHEIYTRADARYSGRVTVPILWDRKAGTIVCNESEDIVRMFDEAGTQGPKLYPERLRAEIDEVDALMYEHVNNGVYECGFARSQSAYEEAFRSLFATLDRLSARLAGHPYLVGDTLTEADIRLFVTLVRFDAVYFGHFKCNRNRIEDDPVLQAYLERLWGMPAFRDTTRFDEIKQHYYGSHRNINPSGIVPVGPRLHLRDS
jgi:putative glutathione S-transferase